MTQLEFVFDREFHIMQSVTDFQSVTEKLLCGVDSVNFVLRSVHSEATRLKENLLEYLNEASM